MLIILINTVDHTHCHSHTGPPLAPSVLNVIEGARTATIMWEEPFSLIPVLNYRVTLLNAEGDTPIATFVVMDTEVEINETHLDPFTSYQVHVTARNRAGASSPGTFQFTTAEAGRRRGLC